MRLLIVRAALRFVKACKKKNIAGQNELPGRAKSIVPTGLIRECGSPLQALCHETDTVNGQAALASTQMQDLNLHFFINIYMLAKKYFTSISLTDLTNFLQRAKLK